MRAAVFHNGKFQIEQVSDPSPVAGQLLVRPIVCGICGSDLSIRKDAPHLCDVLHRAGFRGFMDPAKPVVMGHEFTCEVIDTGKDCTRFRKGDRLVALPFLGSPEGVQLLGYSNGYNGAFAEAMLVDEAAATLVPGDVPDDVAALAEPLAVAVHAINVARPDKDCAFGVVGCGPVGLFVIARLKAMGLGPVIAIEPNPARRALAEKMGADFVFGANDPAANDWWAGLGLPVGLSDSMAVDPLTKKRQRAIFFDCVGTPGLLMNIAANAPVESLIIGIGTCKDDDTIEPAFLLQKGIGIQFVFAYSPQEFADGFDMICRNPDALAPMISRSVGLGGLDEAFDALSGGKGDIKILVRPDL
jgi:threonine dehydrogenase-like Zn-dependent dehydrogenase